MYLVRQNSLYVQYSYFTGSGKIAPRDYFAGSGKIAPRGYFAGSGKIATALKLTLFYVHFKSEFFQWKKINNFCVLYLNFSFIVYVCIFSGQGSPITILQSTPTKAGPSAELREDFARVYKTTGLDVVAKEVRTHLTWSRGFKTFFMLSSAETKIYPAHRVPTSTGKHGKWQKKNPCKEKSWNLKNDKISWKNHGILLLKWQFGCLWDSFFFLTRSISINK